MRVVDEHECKYLKNQNLGEKDVIAVQEMVQDTKSGVKYQGWYWVMYKEKVQIWHLESDAVLIAVKN